MSTHRPAPTSNRGSFVRWPEHHVYARVHGDRLGLGTYDHVPVPVTQADLAEGAGLAWVAESFEQAIARAEELLPAAEPVRARLTGECGVRGHA